MPALILLYITSCLLMAAYVLLMILYRRGWQGQKTFHAAPGFCPGTRISVIIPARNEAAHIGACIRSLLAQQYPSHLLDIVVVDDHSEDHTREVVSAFDKPDVRCIRLSDYLREGEKVVAFKKKALAAGISQSRGELIITTDADCLPPAGWLHHMAALYEQGRPVMIIAPVDFTCDGSVLQRFQSLDFMTMQGITAAVHRLRMGNMSNGANLAFSRAAYEQIDGYAGTEHLASGDDYLLTTKMRQAFPGRISYLKSEEAIVQTAPQPDWRGLLQQRIRWASKSGKYDDARITATLLLVYLLNIAFAVVAVTAVWDPGGRALLAGLFAGKVTAELYFLWPVAAFFGKRRQLLLFPFFQPLHILYIIVAGCFGLLGSYRWKGRSISGHAAVCI